MKDRKRLHLMILGGESSGKTTFLTWLWNKANQSLLTNSVNDYFRPLWESLTSEKSVTPTPAAANLPGHIPFLFDTAEGALEVTAIDYAGSKAEALLKNENNESNREQSRELAQCDAILFLIDSVKLCREGSTEYYAALFKNLEEWLSRSFLESHNPHKPVYVLCTRSDLVSEKELNSKKKELNSYFHNSELQADVLTVSIFGKNKDESLSTEGPDGKLFEPGENGPQPNIDVIALLTDIYRKHITTQRRSLSKTKKIALTLIIVVPILLSIFFTGAADRPLTLEEVEDRLNQIDFFHANANRLKEGNDHRHENEKHAKKL